MDSRLRLLTVQFPLVMNPKLNRGKLGWGCSPPSSPRWKLGLTTTTQSKDNCNLHDGKMFLQSSNRQKKNGLYFLFPQLPAAQLNEFRTRTAANRHSSGKAPSPRPVNEPVCICPCLTSKMPGNCEAQEALAFGQYWRALASIAVTPLTCAARPAE